MSRIFSALSGMALGLFLAAAPILSFAAPAVPPAGLVGVCSAIVYDLDNDVILFEQNPDQQIPPASLTKVMSMYLARDFIADGHASFDTPVRISNAAATAGGSSMGLRAGETVPFRKLLLGMAVSSGNDASHAVAEEVGGSAANFVKMMNARAKQLGMKDSHFLNPHGLPAEGQYTTARDMLTLARAYLRSHPDSLEMHNTKILEHGGYRSWNKNPLLDQYPGADGLKTGWIRASGYNLIFTASKGGKRLLAVILGAPTVTMRGVEACRLLDAGFLVCDNEAVSIAAALDSIPFDEKRLDPFKTGREAGLLRVKKAYAKKTPTVNKRRLSDRSRWAQKSLQRKSAEARRLQKHDAQARRQHAQRTAGRARRS